VRETMTVTLRVGDHESTWRLKDPAKGENSEAASSAPR
jgi:hypothetical protein